MKLYGQRCAFCMVRVAGWDGVNMVDGAHIQPFAKFRGDRLCKWAGPLQKPPVDL